MSNAKPEVIQIQAVLSKNGKTLKFRLPDGTKADTVEAAPGQKIEWKLITPPSDWTTFFSVVFSPLDKPTSADNIISGSERQRAVITLDKVGAGKDDQDPSYKYTFVAYLDRANTTKKCPADHAAPRRLVKAIVVDPIIIIRKANL